MWERLTYKSGFVSIGRKVHGGWEHCNPVNPDMHDEIIKVENDADLTMASLKDLFGESCFKDCDCEECKQFDREH